MSTLPRHTALITGASGGIGRDLAVVAAEQGCDLIVVARRRDKLEELAAETLTRFGRQTTILEFDLSDPASPDALAAAITAANLSVDILINNAGFADYSPFHEADLAKLRQMMQLNMVTLTHLTHLFLPGMLSRHYGRILNVASTAAFMPGPLMAVYYATKAYVLSFSEAIAEELKGSGVTVTALCPGPTASGFQARAQMEESRLVQDGLMSSLDVARQGYDAMMRGQTVYIPGWVNRIQAFSPRLMPRSLLPGIVHRAQARVAH